MKRKDDFSQKTHHFGCDRVPRLWAKVQRSESQLWKPLQTTESNTFFKVAARKSGIPKIEFLAQTCLYYAETVRCAPSLHLVSIGRVHVPTSHPSDLLHWVTSFQLSDLSSVSVKPTILRISGLEPTSGINHTPTRRLSRHIHTHTVQHGGHRRYVFRQQHPDSRPSVSYAYFASTLIVPSRRVPPVCHLAAAPPSRLTCRLVALHPSPPPHLDTPCFRPLATGVDVFVGSLR